MAVKITLLSYKHSNGAFTFKIKANYSKYCPVLALLKFCRSRGDSGGVFFVKKNGRPVGRNFLVSRLKSWLCKLGLNSELYNTHSFRIGRATDLAKVGVPEQVIKATGRWKSEAFARYIRFDDFTLPTVLG